MLEKYALSEIDYKTIMDKKFNVKNITKISDNKVKTFIKDLHKVAMNYRSDEGMDEAKTDRLVQNLLVQTFGLSEWPLNVR